MATGCVHPVEHSIVYEWKIKGITSFLKAAKSLEDVKVINSHKFSSGAKIEDSWFIKLETKKDSDVSENGSWMSLNLVSNNGNKIRAKYSILIFILNDEKRRRYVNLTLHIDPIDYLAQHYEANEREWGFKKFAKINELLEKKEEFLPNDILTVGVHLTVFEDYLDVNNRIASLEGCTRKLNDDFKDLLTAKKNFDVVILVGDKKFGAHKIILTTRSCVFEAMFSHDMKEKKENEVTITDIDGDVFEKLLEYIYTDKVEDLDTFAEGLLEASDKYQLQGLKEICEDYLAKALSIDNVIKILILADRHSPKRLKEVVDNYVVSYFIRFQPAHFTFLIESYPSLFLACVKKWGFKLFQ